MEMNDVIFNIPPVQRENYRKQLTVLRSANVGEIVGALREADRPGIVGVQILSPTGDLDPAVGEFFSIPVDLLLVNVEMEYPNLYQWVALPEEGPARVSIPVVAGFGKAVKLALALGFAVKIEAIQPDAVGIREMHQVLDLYLHRPGICQPVEFFHSMLLAFYHDQPASLWAIQEEDPAGYCYVTDEGNETISRRFAGQHGTGNIETFLDRFKADLLAQGQECRDCEHFDQCGGYFKWPDRAYRCEGIKSVFRNIRTASEELKRDTAAFTARQETAST